MAGGITLEIAQSQLTQALSALEAARQMQSYQVGSASGARRVDRAEFAALQADVTFWNKQVAQLSRGGGLRTWSAVPR